MFCHTSFSFVLLLSLAVSVSAKVVILFSVPHIANQRTHTNVGRALKELGHEPYVCIPHFMLEQNVIDIEGINVIPYGRYLDHIEDDISLKSLEAVWRGSSQSISDFREIGDKISVVVRHILSDQELLNKLRSLKADFLLLGLLPPFPNLAVLPYILDIKFAYMSPIFDFFGQRVPFHLASTPCQLNPNIQLDGRSMWSRMKTATCHLLLAFYSFLVRDDNLVHEFAPHRPFLSIDELMRRAELFLVESDVILDYSKPTLPHMKMIGGTAVSPGKPLQEPFKSFVEGSQNGIAIVTFGSMVVNMPKHITDKMVAAFQSQGLDVVWRVNLESPIPKKILTSLWVPQNDILAHPKTKIFVSHCGANGQYEALYHGVPILCLPLILDQHYNAQRTTIKGFGLHADIHLPANELADLMREVSGNETYRKRVKQASVVFKELYRAPHKEAAFWIDVVMEFSGAHMRARELDMPMYKILQLDALLLSSVVWVVIVLVVCSICQCCFRACCKREKNDKRLNAKKTE